MNLRLLIAGGLLLIPGCSGDRIAPQPDAVTAAPAVYRAALRALEQNRAQEGSRFLVHAGTIEIDEDGVPILWTQAHLYAPAQADAIRTAVEDLESFRICGEVGELPCRPEAQEYAVMLSEIRWRSRTHAWLSLTEHDGSATRTILVETVQDDGTWQTRRFAPVFFEN